MTEEEMQQKIATLELEVTQLKNSNFQLLGEKNSANANLKLAEAERDGIKTQVEKLNAELSVEKIDNQIATKLAAGGVVPDMMEPLSFMMKAKAKINEAGVAMVGDVPLEDYIKTELASPRAKGWIAAPENQGASAPGSTDAASAWSKAPETDEEFDRWMRDAAANPAMTNALAEKWGMPELKSS